MPSPTPIRVLIVDDSPTSRAILMARLAKDGDIQVVGTASTANEGRAQIKLLNPDVVTLDIEMPGMNGFAFLEKIMKLRPMPVIVVSSATKVGNAASERALASGAVDCYSKTDSADGLAIDDGGKLAAMIRRAAVLRHRLAPVRCVQPRREKDGGENGLIAIGASTGGVEALETLLRDFPEDCPATLIVQHVCARFAPAIAKTLDRACPAKVVVAESGMPLQHGSIYLAPGDERHMVVTECGRFIKLRPGAKVSGHVPSIDALFSSVARAVVPRSVGILLTGMGSDGARGLLAMARAGARTIVQNEETSTVFGMPRAAIKLGAASTVAPIQTIAKLAFAQSGGVHAAG